jgi:hypothetical protein
MVLSALLLSTWPVLGADLKVTSENGITTIVYNGQQVFAGATSGPVSAKAISDNGAEYAAAFDGQRVIWESVPGAAERIKSFQK